THIADARDSSGFTSATDERLSIRVTAECNDIRWKLKPAPPTIQWVVVSMHNERRNIALGKTLHLIPEGNQRPQIPVLRVIDIAGNNKEVRPRCNRMIHHTPQRTQSCRLQPLFQRNGRGYASTKRAVKMEVCGMDESQRIHVGVFMTCTGQIRSLNSGMVAG